MMGLLKRFCNWILPPLTVEEKRLLNQLTFLEEHGVYKRLRGRRFVTEYRDAEARKWHYNHIRPKIDISKFVE